MKRKYFAFAIAGIVSIPLWLWGAWVLTPKRKLVVAIIDKTEFEKKGRQHMALTWVLNNERYSKTRNKLYDVSNDYYGFYPQEKSAYKIKGLERFSSPQLEQLSNDCDVAYLVDTYGVYNSDLPQNNNSINKGTGIVYGGMSQQDIDFLKKVKNKKKLIISEHNILGSPTPPAVRKQFEEMFALNWSGWIARYFDSFDAAENKDLPVWLVNNYKVRNGGKWPFTKAGIAFINELGDVVVLEDVEDLNNPVPFIKATPYAQATLHLPEFIKFPFWFDVVAPDTTVNTVVATFNISYTEKGRHKLAANHIPMSIPAVTMHKGNDYEFYYFSGSFCSANTLTISSSSFKGISAFKSFLYDTDDTLESTSFFWNFYRPLMSTVLGDYYKRTNR